MCRDGVIVVHPTDRRNAHNHGRALRERGEGGRKKVISHLKEHQHGMVDACQQSERENNAEMTGAVTNELGAGSTAVVTR